MTSKFIELNRNGVHAGATVVDRGGVDQCRHLAALAVTN